MPLTNKTMPGASAPPPQQVTAAQTRRSIPCEIDDSVIARPLQMPGEEIILKDKSMEPRWVNYDVGERHSNLRFSQMKSAGYIPCKPEDVEKGLAGCQVGSDGRVVNGDTILMMIKKSVIDGAKKWNWERAMRRRGRQAAQQKGRDIIREEVKGPKSQLGKISTFVPSDTELGALVGTDTDTK